MASGALLWEPVSWDAKAVYYPAVALLEIEEGLGCVHVVLQLAAAHD